MLKRFPIFILLGVFILTACSQEVIETPALRNTKYGVVGLTINTTARIESFTVGGQVIVSPTLIGQAGEGLVLADEVEVHAKGMKEPLRCRQLLGHEQHPMVAIGGEVTCTNLLAPVPVQYLLLSGKHFDVQMVPASFVALSPRQAVLESPGLPPLYSNLLLRLEDIPGDAEVPEFYAKVTRALEGESNRCVIHFTSVSIARGPG